MLAKEKLDDQRELKNQRLEREASKLNRMIEESKQTQARIADRICVLTIENKTLADDKEVLMLLLQNVYRAVHGKQHNVRGFVSQIENDSLKAKVVRILQ